MTGPGWLERLLGIVFVVLVVALALRWAVQLIVPVLPLLVGITVAVVVVAVAGRLYVRRRREW